MERIDVVIVGGGLGGLACAYCLAKEGIQVLVLERGDHPGSKNVTGGRIYLRPLKPFLPELLDEAPLERLVTKEAITMMGDGSSFTLQFTSEKFREETPHSYTILRSRFDKWFGERVMDRGGFVVPQRRVTELLKEDGRVVGVVSEGEEIPADVVIIADGALSLFAQKAGLRGPLPPRNAAVGIKEVVKLQPEVIEERFGLKPGEGMAHLFFGSITHGAFGGGFLYTNSDTISLGLVIGIESFLKTQPPTETHRLLEEFKEREEVAHFIRGGELVEYSAHLIPEGGRTLLSRPYGDGILVVGDAAGFALNMGITVRGMEFALASGCMAAQAVKRAKETGDFSASSLAYYEDLLRESFILQDMETFRDSLEVVENPRLFNFYPRWLCNILEEIFWIGEGPKEKISSTLWRGIKEGIFNIAGLKDVWRFRRI
ncbi:MAG: electron transfer flavoprotein [Deltaproteobacteria bacterium]|nr:MAG: electron transfer flavoprotein [Deltaproteobacteria bacterium]